MLRLIRKPLSPLVFYILVMIPLPPISPLFPYTTLFRSMSRKIILIKQELLLLVYELNRSGLLAENEKIRPILAQQSTSIKFVNRSEERFSRNAETDLVCRLLLVKKKIERDHVALAYLSY